MSKITDQLYRQQKGLETMPESYGALRSMFILPNLKKKYGIKDEPCRNFKNKMPNWDYVKEDHIRQNLL